MFVERDRIPIGDLDDVDFSAYLGKLKPGEHKDPKEALDNLNLALGKIKTFYEAKDSKSVIKGFNQIVESASPLMWSYLKERQQKGDYLSGDQEIFIYTLCQAANDAARSCQEASNQPKLSKVEKDKTNALALFFQEKQIKWGTAMGDDVISLRALNNLTQIGFDRAIRLFYIDGEKEKARNIIVNEIRNIAGHFNFAKIVLKTTVGMNTGVEYESALNGRKKTADNELASLQFMANTLNRWGVLHTTLAEMHDPVDDPIEQIKQARKVLDEAGRFHLNRVEKRTPRKEFLERSMAIESNHAYTYILQANIAENLNSINIVNLSQIMSNINNHFIKKFLNPMQFLEKETDIPADKAKRIKDHFTAESITRSIEVLKIMFLANTSTSTTTNPEYELLERTVFSGILGYADSLSFFGSAGMDLSKMVEKEYTILNKKQFFKLAIYLLIGMGEMHLQNEDSSPDDEDRICFNRTKSDLRKLEFAII